MNLVVLIRMVQCTLVARNSVSMPFRPVAMQRIFDGGGFNDRYNWGQYHSIDDSEWTMWTILGNQLTNGLLRLQLIVGVGHAPALRHLGPGHADRQRLREQRRAGEDRHLRGDPTSLNSGERYLISKIGRCLGLMLMVKLLKCICKKKEKTL